MRQPVENIKWMVGHEDLKLRRYSGPGKYLGTSTPVVVIEVLGLDERVLEFYHERHGGSGLRLEKHQHLELGQVSHKDLNRVREEVRSQEEPGNMAS